MKIAVIGGTGKVGRLVIDRLQDYQVRALVWTETAAAGLREQTDAELAHADLDEPSTLGPALKGIDTLFIATPFHPQQTSRELAAVEAAEEAGVSRLVKVSSYAAGVRPTVPSAAAHIAVEARLRRSTMQWSALRPDWWLDNILTQLDHVREGETFYPAGSAVVTAVDARDLADVAVAEIVADVPAGGSLILTGPESVTLAEVAERLGRAVNAPMVLRDDVAPDWPDYYAEGMRRLFASYRDRGFAPRTHTIEEVLGKPARSIEQFATEVLQPALSKANP
ncbi:MAG TPA: NAD(P)H-binding protein [Arthrobacter sp.]|nr:NAD(P)H-binding protein [Arthrobacter sp.]